MTTRAQISEWFDHGVAQSAKYMLVLCQSFEVGGRRAFTFRPNYSADDDRCKLDVLTWSASTDHRVIEVYDLTKDRDEQIAQHRVWNVPSC